MDKAHYAANLRLLCSYHGAVTGVCRRIGINRQQFTKYLSAASLPSQHNHRRICDFFGVDTHEMMLPPDRFAELVRLRPSVPEQDDVVMQMLRQLADRSARPATSLIKYHGYYYKYFSSFSNPGYILRSLVVLYAYQGRTLYKTVERIKRPSDRRSFTFKYNGIMIPMGERLHMIDYESILRNEISQTILFPTYLNRVSYLSGLIIGVSGNEAHQPVSARVVMEYLGQRVAPCAALKGCGLFLPNSAEIHPMVSKGIDNTTPGGMSQLNAIPR